MDYSASVNARSRVRRKRGEKGSVFVEFGLVLVPTLGLLFMSMNLAWVLFGWACLQEGVREGVRYGVPGPVSSGLDAAIKQFVTTTAMGFMNNNNSPSIHVQYFSPTTLTEVTGQSGATQSGNVLKVTASISIRSLVPVWKANGTALGTFTSWTPFLAAASADVLETATPSPSE